MSEPSGLEILNHALTELLGSIEGLVVLNANTSWDTSEHLNNYPDKFFECSESEFVGVGVGLARSGLVAVCVGSPHSVMNQLEGIRRAVSFPPANLKIIGFHQDEFEPVPTWRRDGNIEWNDFAGLRAMPNMILLQPADLLTAKAAIHFAAVHSGPAYIRLSQNLFPTFYRNSEVFQAGRGILLKEGASIALIASGETVIEALSASEELSDLNPWVVDMHTLRPLDRALLKTLAFSCQLMVTVEDHNAIGGLGSSTSELLTELGYQGKLIRIGSPGEKSENPGGKSFSASEIVKKVRSA